MFDGVIQRLVNLQRDPAMDDLYSWLDVVFAYAAGKPFVYCSRYQPSPRVFGLARTHGVQLVWSPLHEIPPALLERHGTWRLLWLSESQSECLAERLATAKTDRPAAVRSLTGPVTRIR